MKFSVVCSRDASSLCLGGGRFESRPGYLRYPEVSRRSSIWHVRPRPLPFEFLPRHQSSYIQSSRQSGEVT